MIDDLLNIGSTEDNENKQSLDNYLPSSKQEVKDYYSHDLKMHKKSPQKNQVYQ